MKVNVEQALARVKKFAERADFDIVEMTFELQPKSEDRSSRFSAVSLTVHPEDLEDFNITGAPITASPTLKNRYIAALWKAPTEEVRDA